MRRDALLRHGAPALLVSDSGAVFLAKQAQAIDHALGIEQREIARGKPWQHDVEAFFGVQKRMGDDHFARAASWPELHAVHARFFRDDHHQRHFAHGGRTDGRHSPAKVLGFVHGAWCDPTDRDRLFRLRIHRRVDRHGFVRYRHWRFYGERGLAGAEAAVWVFGNDLTVAYASDTLAQYHRAYAPDGRAIRRVREPRLFGTRYPSPQPFLHALGELAWRPALRLPRFAPRRRRAPRIDQEPLFLLDDERAANEG